MKLNCIIVDDEPVARKLLEEYIEDVDFLQLVGKAENPVKANVLLNNSKVDVMFLDINMPKMSGIGETRSRLEPRLGRRAIGAEKLLAGAGLVDDDGLCVDLIGADRLIGDG